MGKKRNRMRLLALFVVVSVATDYFPFQYKDCGSGNEPVQIVNPSLSPSPVQFNANVTASGTLKVAHDITAANAGSLTFKVQKHALIWVDIPCSAIPGGCSYPNFCTIDGGNVNNSTCAMLKHLGLPCGCPVPAGTYVVPATTEHIGGPPKSLSWLVDGSFRIQLQLNDNQGNSVLCAEITDSVK